MPTKKPDPNKWEDTKAAKAKADAAAAGVANKFGYGTKASPSPQVRVAPMQSLTEAQRQDKALKDLMAKRQAEAKRTGQWNNYYTN